jgi:hypothetical protein
MEHRVLELRRAVTVVATELGATSASSRFCPGTNVAFGSEVAVEHPRMDFIA